MSENESEQIASAEMLPSRMYSKLQNAGCCMLKNLSKAVLAACSTCLLVLTLFFYYLDSHVIIFVVLFALVGLFCRLQEHLLYHPNEPVNARLFVELPSAVGLPFENHYIRTRDGYILNLYLIKQSEQLLPNAPTIVFFHGNAGNIGHRLMLARAVYDMVAANVVMVDYRGYGKSSGTPNEQGFSIDAEATLDFVLQRNDINVRRVFVHGSSLGGAVATYVASLPYYADRIAGLLLENTFTCIPDMGRSLFAVNLLKYLPQWVFSEQYPSMERIQRVTVPTLFLSGLADTLVPPRMMDILYLKCGSRVKVMLRFESGTHNDTWLCSGYYESVARFLTQVTQGLATSVVWEAQNN